MNSTLESNVRVLLRPESDVTAPGRRWKTDWPAEIIWSSGGSVCTVLDISSWGAKLQAEVLPSDCDRVRLRIDGVGTIAAAVVWQRDGMLGVQFLQQQTWLRRLRTRGLDPSTWSRDAGAPQQS